MVEIKIFFPPKQIENFYLPRLDQAFILHRQREQSLATEIEHK